jgi:hypothetical protein
MEFLHGLVPFTGCWFVCNKVLGVKRSRLVLTEWINRGRRNIIIMVVRTGVDVDSVADGVI